MSEADGMVWVVGRQRAALQVVEQPFLIAPRTMIAWEPLGIYDDRQRAIARCTEECDFVGQIPFGVDLPDEPYPWPGVSYPLLERKHGHQAGADKAARVGRDDAPRDREAAPSGASEVRGERPETGGDVPRSDQGPGGG